MSPPRVVLVHGRHIDERTRPRNENPPNTIRKESSSKWRLAKNCCLDPPLPATSEKKPLLQGTPKSTTASQMTSPRASATLDVLMGVAHIIRSNPCRKRVRATVPTHLCICPTRDCSLQLHWCFLSVAHILPNLLLETGSIGVILSSTLRPDVSLNSWTLDPSSAGSTRRGRNHRNQVEGPFTCFADLDIATLKSPVDYELELEAIVIVGREASSTRQSVP